MNKLSLIITGTALSACLCLSPVKTNTVNNTFSNFPNPIVETITEKQVEETKEEIKPKNARIEINLPATTLRYFENNSLIMQTPTCIGARRLWIKRLGR